MRTITKMMLGLGALWALGLVYGCAPPPPRHGEVYFDTGVVAFGYEDGYWDRDHRWHGWASHDDWDRFRRDHHDHAYGWRHDRDPDQGWHDRYWH